MENKLQIDGSTRSRRLRPPVCPYSRTTTAVPHASNSHHLHRSLRRPFHGEPAAATNHFSSQSRPGCQAHQLPLSPLPSTNHASAGGSGTGASVVNTISPDTASGSGWDEAAAGSSSYQRPPSQGALPGSSRYHQAQPRSWPASVATFGGGLQESSPLPLLAQSNTSVDLGLTIEEEEYDLPPLPPSLGGPPTSLQTATAVGLEAVRPAGPVYVSLGDSDDDDSGNNYSVHYAGLQSSPIPAPAAAWVKKGAANWSSRGTSQLGNNNTIAGSGISSMCLTLAQNSLPAAAGTKFGVKSTIASGGSSSLLSMPQPAYSSVKTGPMVAGSKRNLPSSPAMGWGSGGAPGTGSSIRYKDDANNDPVVPDFADGLFTQKDINKIMEEKRLKDMVLTDPKRVRRILRNRSNAHKSMKKKAAYLSSLENKFEQLQQEKKSLSARVNSLESAALLLKDENNEMAIKLHGFEQKIQLANAKNETLNAEVYRLKLASGDIRGSHVSKSSYQEMSPQTTQQDNLQIHEHQVAQLQQELEQLVDLDNFFTQQI